MTISKIQKRTRTGFFLSCEECNAEFYIPPSRITQAEKLGCRIAYCSRACRNKNISGEKNPMWGKTHSQASIDKFMKHPNRHSFKRGKDNPNFIRYGMDFDPKTPYLLRNRLIVRHGMCQRCGFDKEIGILEIHHISRDRSDNAMTNVELLCPNCHSTEHFKNNDGKYHKKPNGFSFRKRNSHSA